MRAQCIPRAKVCSDACPSHTPGGDSQTRAFLYPSDHEFVARLCPGFWPTSACTTELGCTGLVPGAPAATIFTRGWTLRFRDCRFFGPGGPSTARGELPSNTDIAWGPVARLRPMAITQRCTHGVCCCWCNSSSVCVCCAWGWRCGRRWHKKGHATADYAAPSLSGK